MSLTRLVHSLLSHKSRSFKIIKHGIFSRNNIKEYRINIKHRNYRITYSVGTSEDILFSFCFCLIFLNLKLCLQLLCLFHGCSAITNLLFQLIFKHFLLFSIQLLRLYMYILFQMFQTIVSTINL